MRRALLHRAGRGGLAVALLAPLGVFALSALSLRWFYPQPFPTEWTITTLQRTLSDPRVIAGARDGLTIAIAVTALSLAIGYPAARVLGLRRFAGRQAAWTLLFLPTVVPPLAIGMGLNIVFLRAGLAGTLIGVILAHLVPTLPYVIFTLAGAFARYDEGFEHQALALGAGRLRTLFTISLPLLAPGLLVAGLFAFLISWSQYLLTLLVGSGRILTLPVLVFSAAAGGNPATTAALSLIFLGPPLVVIAATAWQLRQPDGPVHEPF